MKEPKVLLPEKWDFRRKYKELVRPQNVTKTQHDSSATTTPDARVIIIQRAPPANVLEAVVEDPW